MEIEVSFDLKVYSLDTLKKAAYRYINVFSINFDIHPKQVTCSLAFTDKFTPDQCKYYVDQFKKEVLDQDLRNTIKNETEPVRNLILAQAFSKTGLVDDE